MALLFVYGSLRRGEPNHAQLEGARFVGPARTPARYTLVVAGEFPAMVEGGRDTVAGEVYDVPPALLDALDAFEEHPSVYRRRLMRLEDGREVFAYLRADR